MEHVLGGVWPVAKRLLRRPALPLAIVISMAVGLGTVCAFARIANQVVWRPLALPDSSDLVVVGRRFPNTYQDGRIASHLRSGLTTMSSVAVQGETGHVRVNVNHQTQAVPSIRVGAGYFETLQLPLVAGREFDQRDEQGTVRAVLISNKFWTNNLGRQGDIIGQPLLVDGALAEVIGIVGPGVPELTAADVFLPLVVNPADRGRNYLVIGRLRTGVTLGASQAELTAMTSTLAASGGPDAAPVVLNALPLQRALGLEVFPALTLMTAGVIFTALIAFANILLLTALRALAHQSEVATRVSLGAGRRDLWWHLVIESATLGVAGAAGGAVVAAVFIRGTQLYTGQFNRWEIAADPAWTTLPAALPVVAAMLLLSWRMTRRFAARGPQLGERGTTTKTSRQRGLLGIQAAVATTLVILAVQLVVTLQAVRADEFGFRTRDITAIEYWEGGGAGGDARRPDAFDTTMRLVQALESVDGVKGAAFSTSFPSQKAFRSSVHAVRANGEPTRDRNVDVFMVTPGYLELLNVRPVRGRTIEARDASGAEPVVVISAALARILERDGVPAATEVSLVTPTGTLMTRQVVGVVGNVRNERLDDRGHLAVYVPFAQLSPEDRAMVTGRVPSVLTVLCEPACKPDGLERVFSLHRAGDRPTSVRAVSAMVDGQIRKARLEGSLIVVVALLACAMAGMGIYAIAALTTRQRFREIGIRMALGARTLRLHRDLFSGVAWSVSIGTIVGIAGGVMMMSVLRVAMTFVTVDSGSAIAYVAGAAVVPALAASAALRTMHAALAAEPARVIQTAQS